MSASCTLHLAVVAEIGEAHAAAGGVPRSRQRQAAAALAQGRHEVLREYPGICLDCGLIRFKDLLQLLYTPLKKLSSCSTSSHSVTHVMTLAQASSKAALVNCPIGFAALLPLCITFEICDNSQLKHEVEIFT